MSASSPPGWYPDPIADDLERWWDGDAWSESEFRFARSSGSHHDAGLDPFDGILGSIISGQWVGTMKSRLGDFAVSIGLPAVGAAIDPEPVPSELGDSVDGIDRDDVSMDGSASIGEPLAGGNMGDVLRIGDTVRRASGEWTPAVHLLLRTLRSAGILDVPEPLGLDETGREVLSFISGRTWPMRRPGCSGTKRCCARRARCCGASTTAVSLSSAKTSAGVRRAASRPR
ncbi:DUF2510 domain-containing protein [Agromyces soli]